MSKSLGNAIDPIEVIDEMGADALRFSMIMLSAQDVYLSREKFEVGRNFTNKLWNAARFVLMNLEEFKEGSRSADFDFKKLSLTNRWILSRLEGVTEEIEKYLSGFGLAQASNELYHFVWNDFCDWFIELSKASLISNDQEEKCATQKVLFFVLERILRLLHPFMPFLTEEIWDQFKEMAKDKKDWPEKLMLAGWPHEAKRLFQDAEAERSLDLLQKAIGGIRDLRARLNIPPAQTLHAIISTHDKKVEAVFSSFEEKIKKIGRLETLKVETGFKKDKSVLGNAFANFEVFIRIEGLVDPEKERERIQKKIQETYSWIKSMSKKLSNENFVNNAPADVVQKEKDKLADAEKILKAHQEHLALYQ
jgi:valyl-tRNA synthetase